MTIPATDHYCRDDSGYYDYRLRVLTGKIVYRLSSIRNDWDGGPCVHVRQVLGGELGPRELISLRKLDHVTAYTEDTPGEVLPTQPSA